MRVQNKILQVLLQTPGVCRARKNMYKSRMTALLAFVCMHKTMAQEEERCTCITFVRVFWSLARVRHIMEMSIYKLVWSLFVLCVCAFGDAFLSW